MSSVTPLASEEAGNPFPFPPAVPALPPGSSNKTRRTASSSPRAKRTTGVVGTQVTSRGCSRSFIVSLFFRLLEYVMKENESGNAIFNPLPDAVLEKMLQQAKQDTLDVGFAWDRLFGGTHMDANDESTFWNKVSHFKTWTKNNVERKAKQILMANTANTETFTSEKDLQRKAFCSTMTRLTNNIALFYTKNRTLKKVTQIWRMPAPIPAFINDRLHKFEFNEDDIPQVVLSSSASATPQVADDSRKNTSSYSSSRKRKVVKKDTNSPYLSNASKKRLLELGGTDEGDDEDDRYTSSLATSEDSGYTYSTYASGISHVNQFHEVRDIDTAAADNQATYFEPGIALDSIDFTGSPRNWGSLVSPFDMQIETALAIVQLDGSAPPTISSAPLTLTLLDEILAAADALKNSPFLTVSSTDGGGLGPSRPSTSTVAQTISRPPISRFSPTARTGKPGNYWVKHSHSSSADAVGPLHAMGEDSSMVVQSSTAKCSTTSTTVEKVEADGKLVIDTEETWNM